MPIYEYECDKKHRFEKWQSMNDEPIKECPTCGSSVRKVMHPAGIIFKGSGFYQTDYKTPPSGKPSQEKSNNEKQAPCASGKAPSGQSGCGACES